jgi:AAA+ superfamily predicted ATPase
VLPIILIFSGILVLTTNQIAQFDVAVQSRIHIAIKYEKLDKVQTLAIFRQFLEQLKGQGLVKNMDGILDWLEDDVWSIGFDGRQIRNIMSSALSLARADQRTQLEKNDIKMVAGIVKDFKNDFRSQYEKYINDQKGLIS